MKRFLALVLTVMMLTTCFATVATAAGNAVFSDVPEDAVALTAIKTLNQMSVINGYPDGTFGPDKNVTRAEFTAMLMRTLGIGSIGSAGTEDLPFTDVDVNNSDISWAIPDINTAYAKGIINGYEDQTFRPSANVAYEEAVKMIVCSLGYVMSVDVTPWYTQYISQAAKLGITETASLLGSAETPASRACIAQMLYDSLEVPLVENQEVTSKTILTDYLGYTKGTGKIASNGVTSLTAPDVNLRDNEIQIDNGLTLDDPSYEVKTYQTTDSELKNYLGYEVDYYYKDNGSNIRTLALYVLKQNTSLVLTDAMIEEGNSNATQIRYYKTEEDKSATVAMLDTGNVVIYNGKLLGATEDSSRFDISLIPQVGSIELIDGDGNGKYEVIKIEDYTIYYVSSKVSADYSIIDDVTKIGEAKKLTLNVDDSSSETSIVNASGQTVDYNSISTGDIICLATSKSTNGGKVLRKAVVVSDTVKGTITGMEGNDVLTISGTKYRVSKAAPWLNGIGSAPALQDVGVFCKDINGDIVAYKRDAATENISYGYIMGVENIGNFDEGKKLQILTGSGSIVTVYLKDNVRIDDQSQSYSAAEAMAYLETSVQTQNKDTNTNLGIHQLIKYTTKVSGGNTVFDKIHTATGTDKGQTIESNKLYFYTPVNGSMKMVYNSTSQKLVHESGVSINIGSVGSVLEVPSNRSEGSGYKKSSVSSLFKNGAEYYVELFDVSTTNTPKVLVCYGKNASTTADSTTPLSVVSQPMENRINDSTSDAMWYMNGYKVASGNNKGTFAEWLSLKSEWTPALGDIFRAGTDDDGFATIKNEHVIYSPSGNVAKYGIAIEPSGSDFYDSEYSVIMGSVMAVDDTSVMILPEKVAAGATPVKDLGEAMTFDISRFSTAQMLLYDVDKSGNLSVTATSEYQGVLSGLVPYDADTQLTNPSKVIVYMVHGQIVMCAVLDDAE